jgi:hypothetical protein
MRYALIIAALALLPQKSFAADVATCPLNKAVYKTNHPHPTAKVTLEIQDNPAYLHPGDITHYFVITAAANDAWQKYTMQLPYGCFASGYTSCNLRFPKERLGVTALDKNFGEATLGSKAPAPHALAIPLLNAKIYYTPHDQLSDFAKAEGRPEDKPVGSGLDLWIFDHCTE